MKTAFYAINQKLGVLSNIAQKTVGPSFVKNRELKNPDYMTQFEWYFYMTQHEKCCENRARRLKNRCFREKTVLERQNDDRLECHWQMDAFYMVFG